MELGINDVWNVSFYSGNTDSLRMEAAPLCSAARKDFLQNQETSYRIEITEFDRDRGSVFDRWLEMGSPAHLLPADRDALEAAGRPSVRVLRPATGAGIPPLRIEPHGVTMVELAANKSWSPSKIADRADLM